MQRQSKPTKGGSTPSKASGKRKRNRRRRIRSRQIIIPVKGRSAGNSITLSNCAEDYLRVLSNPFGDFIEPPCIPDTIAIPSFKFSARARGGFVTGTQGCGWVVFDPWKAWNNGTFSGTSTEYAVMNTLVNYTQTNFTWAVAAGVPTTGVTGNNLNSLFSLVQLATANQTPGRQYRLVGAGLKIMYSGTELNRGGRVIMYRSRTGATIPGNTAVDGGVLLSDQSFEQTQVSRQWHEITHVPDAPYQLGYEPGGSNTTVGGGVDHYTLLAYVDGTVPGVGFQYEAVAHYEMIGGSMPVSPSHSDPVGMGAIVSAIPTVVKTTAGALYNTLRRGTMMALQNSSAFLTANNGVPVQGRRQNQLMITNG